MSVYVVGQGRIEDQEKLDEYVQAALPTVMAGGAKVIAVDVNAEIVEGEPPGPRTVILEFESREAFRAWYDSPEYQAIVGLRLEAAPGHLIVAEGFVPPAD
jgi:uncharacterized protein (DUF1330 family)